MLALEILEKMKNLDINKSALAKLIQTSRSSLDIVLDPNNPSRTLVTLDKVAKAIGKNVHIEVRARFPREEIKEDLLIRVLF